MTEESFPALTARQVLQASSHPGGDVPYIKVQTIEGPALIQWPFEEGAKMVAAVNAAQQLAADERNKAGKSPMVSVLKKKISGIRTGVDHLGQAVVIQVEYADKTTEDVPIPRGMLEHVIGELSRALQGFKAQDGHSKQ